MGFIRLFFELLFPPHRDFSPVPDDWPPDGSLHFVKCTDEAQKAVPGTHIQYEFGANVGEDDRRIVKLSMEIMKRICGSGQVLTKIGSNSEFLKKEKFHPERFPVRYRHFLEDMGSSVSIYARDEKTLEFLTRGFDATAYWTNQEINTTDHSFFDFYVLPDAPAVSSAEDAAKAVAAGKYDVWFSLSEWGPCALYITLNPETVDADTIQRIIESICKEHQILFQNPPQP